MKSSSRQPGTGEYVLLLLFAGTGIWLLYLAAMQDKGMACWTVGTTLLFGAGVVAVPEWRDPFGSALTRVRLKFGESTISLGRTAMSPVGEEVEKRPEDVLPATALVPPAVREASANAVDVLKQLDDPLVYWRAFMGFLKDENFGMARQVIEAALERYPNHPKLLISAGYLWARVKDRSAAIEAARRALDASRGSEEFREQLYVAHSNLCYYLADRGEARDKAEALRLGRTAAEHADEFSDRESFKINYAFAQVRFAASRQEVIGAVAYLTQLDADRLTPAQHGEVDQYLLNALEKLRRNTAAAGV